MAVITAALIGTTPSLAAASPGDLDPTFDGDGIAEISASNESSGVAIAIQDDGKVVAAGHSHLRFALVRYLPDGAPDLAFGDAGSVITRVDDYSSASDIALQANGKIVVGGRSSSGRLDRFALVRYQPDGSLDRRFGEGGKVITGFAAYAGIDAVALQPDGAIVAVGQRGHDIAIARYTHDGNLDPTFSGNGKVTLSVGKRASATGVAIQSDGKIAVVGATLRILTASTYEADFVITRLLPHGRPDPAFGIEGIVTNDLSRPDEGATDVALQADGKILVSGASGVTKPGTNTGSSTLIRYQTDGTLDPTFNGDGWLRTDFGATWAAAHAVAIAGDGSIVVVGQAQIATIGQVFVARYASDGTRDSTFGTNGKVITPIGRAADDVALQADGNIVVIDRTAPEVFSAARFLGA